MKSLGLLGLGFKDKGSGFKAYTGSGIWGLELLDVQGTFRSPQVYGLEVFKFGAWAEGSRFGVVSTVA